MGEEDNPNLWEYTDDDLIDELSRGTDNYGKYADNLKDDHWIIREALKRILSRSNVPIIKKGDDVILKSNNPLAMRRILAKQLDGLNEKRKTDPNGTGFVCLDSQDEIIGIIRSDIDDIKIRVEEK